MRRILIAVLTLAASCPAAHAQAVLDLTAGQPRARPAAPDRSPELFRFLGEPGQTVRVTIQGPGTLEAQLYEPEGGAVMRKASGTDKIVLEAILPLDGVYLASVVRADPAKPYNVTLTREAADPYFAHFVEGVGYSVLMPGAKEPTVGCWMEPGAKIRVNHPGGVVSVVTLGRGAKRYYQTAGATGSIRFESDTRFEGEDAITTYEGLPKGDEVESRSVLDHSGAWTYSSYLCR
jgi:hypothetical protein